MSITSARLSLAFSCIGHTCSHLFQPIFYLVALSLENELGLTHGETVSLVVGGSMLFGFAAPVAGWFGDRWSATGMMTVFFVGTGTAMMLTGLAETPLQIALALGLTGLFASIYHPVGVAWMIRNSVQTGTVLGINGVFGGIGPAVAALIAGSLIDLYGWRAAFVVPGAVILLTGIVFVLTVARGFIVESKTDRKPYPPSTRRDSVRVFIVLGLTMLCSGLIYQATQAATPKVFSDRLADYLGDGVLGVSVIVAGVYLVAGLMQLVGGRLADVYPLKRVYMLAFVAQVPLLIVAASLGGLPVVAVMVVMISVNFSSLPAENVILARYAPSRWRSLIFGIKYVIAIGIAGLGIMMEGKLYDLTGGFFALFSVLAALAAAAVVAILFLPADNRAPVAAAAE